jgi:hypothetical protein
LSDITERLTSGRATTEQALEIFDALEPVELGFMTGLWKGQGFHTHHPMDGLLEAYHRYGKRFDSAEDVHPLIFSTPEDRLVSVNPFWMGLFQGLLDRGLLPRTAAAGRAFQSLLPVLRTPVARARLRMTECRGKSSATMIYDQLPIQDVFRRIDDDAVFGLMDRRGMPQPFFFILRRAPRPAL